ncbi:sensor histidine kinase [Butyrivibrio sp. Su6]|uniref:sensor histidine kinase n=1 Tax=Butyrivibrio sp. Su6 TaxID=1520810 RepID=UPI000CDE64A7|nr:histidine kinase [Butyrivibrio sp. Su6]
MKKFRDQPVFRKISLTLFAIIMVFVLVLVSASLLFYFSRNSQWYYKESLSSSSFASDTLTTHYNVITKHFVKIFGTENLSKLISSDKLSQSNLKPYLEDLQSSDYLIDSTIAIDTAGNMYSYNWSSSGKKMPALSASDFSHISGITFLTQRNSPINTGISTIPIVYPLYVDKNSFVAIASENDAPKLYVVVYLNYNSLISALTSSGVNFRDIDTHELFLFSKGECLNIIDTENDDALANYSALYKKLEITGAHASFADNHECWILTTLSIPNTYLLYHTSAASLYDILGLNNNTIALFLLLIVVVLAVISLLLSRYISKPIQIQAEIVKEIELGTYDKKKEFKTNDEIGRLNKSINQMYDTIQSQIEQIKKEESEKYLAQMLRASEQVNPHFLYNTLDAIQSEVRTGNSENAADLIQYLSEYMRIGLSYGDDTILITQEIQHSNAYIHLMEQRFKKNISFIYQISPILYNTKIPKTILQPLLENSIRHGFGIDADGIPVLQPTIEVNFSYQDGQMTIEVSDNGSGFDPDKVLSIMYNGIDEKTRHVGLHNIYYRLISTYGKENITIKAESIPYYKNTVTMVLQKIEVPRH